jgi:hypothetical protein
VLAASALLGTVGCLEPFVRTRQIVDQFRPVDLPLTGDVVALDIAPLELPITDSATLSAVWAAADEQIVPADFRGRLEDNGLRVGVIGGIPPAEFLNLLTSERTNPAPHQCLKKMGDARAVPIGTPVGECHFQLVLDGTATPVDLSQAQCGLQVTPVTSGQSIALQVVPQIQHGRRTLWPSADATGGWTMHGNRPVERYVALKFEVPVSESEYLVIGAAQRPETLGTVCFTASGDRPLHRLLVIRLGRLQKSSSAAFSQLDGDLPLAAQAARARGTQWR